jgi:invasion protein IalB
MRRFAALIATALAVMVFKTVAVTSGEVRPNLAARLPWMKFCLKETGFKTICITSNEVRNEADRSVVASVAIIEQEDGEKKLRITFQLGVLVGPGTRLIIDRDDPKRSPYLACPASGCVSDYEVNSDMIDGLKRGQTLFVQAVDASAAPLTAQLPLTDFAAAYDGPPSDPGHVERLRSKPKPWLDDTLQPGLRPRAN